MQGQTPDEPYGGPNEGEGTRGYDPLLQSERTRPYSHVRMCPMNQFQLLTHRLESQRDIAFDLLRIYLGIGLFVRGLLLIVRPDTFATLVEGSGATVLASPTVMICVAIVHLIGGAMMTLGLFTRLSALAQIPILLGAVFLIHLRGGGFASDQSFEFSALVLFLLVAVFLHGSGRWSIDAHRARRFIPFRPFVDPLDRAGNYAFELLRMYLGVGLFIRGVLFITHSTSFMELIGASSSAWLTSVVLIHYVALSHLVGGIMIAVGFFTRTASLLQVPILIGAVFLIHLEGGILAAGQSLEFSALVLFLLMLLILWGSGDLSVDRRLADPPVEAEYYRHAGALGDRTTEAKPLLPTEPVGPVVPTCSCGNDANHPLVRVHVRYGTWSAMAFLMGVTGRPKELVYRCDKCGEAVVTTRDPKELERHRYQQ